MGSVDIRDQSRELLVLKSRPYREQDRLLTLLSAEKGVEKAIARAAEKPSSSLRPIAQPYSRVSLLLSPAKGGLSFVREGLLLESFLPLDAGLERLSYAAYFAELTLSVAQPEQSAPGLYGLLLAAWTLLRLDRQPERSARFFELRLLAEQGLLPSLDACGACGACAAPLCSGLAEPQRDFLLSPSRGQLLCAACQGGSPEAELHFSLLSPGALRSAESLLTLAFSRIPSLRISPRQNQELEGALAAYLDYHLEYAPKARSFLRQIKYY
ncbi:MAG: DNA repair protein RecO [Bacillota bacterium]|nr:DNA repair protein RecO [Bacillota bacterium]